jgi:hypothetical protein
VLTFSRPNNDQRHEIVHRALKPLGFTAAQIEAIVNATGTHRDRECGFTFSDLTQRLLPTIVLDAYPNEGIRPARAVEIARAMTPTPPFREDAS